MDQAFVKAFARRNRPAPLQAGDSQAAAAGAHHASAAASLPNGQRDTNMPSGTGQLHLDQAVAGTAPVWIDPNVDQFSRADTATGDVPRPHVETLVRRQPDPSPAVPPSQPLPPTERPSADAALEWHQQNQPAYAAVLTQFPLLDLVQPLVCAATAGVSFDFGTAALDGVATAGDSAAILAEPAAPRPPAASAPAAIETTKIRVDRPTVESRPAPVLASFQAAWEVDVFDVPRVVADLFFDGTLFQQIAERMSDAVRTGLRSVLITSAQRGEGRSSVAIGIAMASAAAGIRVALVDADTEDPSLTDDLRLDLQYGWVDALRGGLPIKEAAVHAVEDGVTLIPLMRPKPRAAATGSEVAQLIELLRERFELIILDGPAATSPHLASCAAVVDSAVVVRDITRTGAAAIADLSSRLLAVGVQGIGVVENRV